MFIAILTLLSALSISGVAIFYSVIGLATIFPGAFWPVVIMGSVLEVGKLVTASWLYRNWKQTRFLLKSYLLIAVVVLSLITSMGIFGFLSKAHLEQNLAEDTVTQRIDIINNKIGSQETYIERQTLIIERAEKSLNSTGKSNTNAIDIEQSSIKAVEEKFKTLLAVETNAIKELNARMKLLDKDVSDVLTANKQFFNEEKAAKELKESQKDERAMINNKIVEAQGRIGILKEDYTKDTAVIQSRIDKLREGDVEDKSDVYAQIKEAEANILVAQNTIDDLVVEREPLESKMIKLEAEVGPVKYIAALAVDWGVTNEVNTSEAVRWVILIIILVFDPLAVLLLVAANQSLLRRFPVQPLPPEEVLDLEKPDEEGIDLKWNEAMAKRQNKKMEQATTQLKEWQQKLQEFNKKVPVPEEKPVKIVQTEEFDMDPIINPDWNTKIQNKKIETDTKSIQDFSLDEVAIDLETEHTPPKLFEQDEEKRIKPDLTEVIETDVGVKDPTTTTVEEALKMPESESVEKPIETKPLIKRSQLDRNNNDEDKEGKVVEPPKPTLSNWQRAELLNNFHDQHGNFEDVDEYVQNEEQDNSTLWQKFTKYKTRITTDTDYHSRMEQRISDLITKLENGTIKLEDLSKEDQKVIEDILNQ